MSDQVSIEWPKEDVRALWAQIARAQAFLGKELGQAIKFAAWSVAQSLGVVTNVAPKYRPYSEIIEGRGVAKRKGGKKYEITSWKKGREHKFNMRAASVRELKQSGKVKIGNAGLAKSAWYWGIKKLGSANGVGMRGVTLRAKQRGAGNIKVTQRLKGNDPFVKMVNDLPYAVSALRGGMSAANSALGKAARHMGKIIDAQIAKKLGAI